LETRFVQLERQRKLLPPDSKLLVAVSGGLDSMSLLHLLQRTRRTFGWDLVVSHVHHGLRPEADEDARTVARAAHSLALPFLEKRVGERILQIPISSLEARARAARLEALEDMRNASQAHGIVLAHTADDRAETLLLNLLRGTGPRGLGALRERRGVFLRPLLPFRRKDLLSYARGLGISWRTDRSNWTEPFARNWIRHRLLPLLEEGAHPRVTENLARAASHLARWAESVEERVQGLLADKGHWIGRSFYLENLESETIDEWTLTQLLREAHRLVSGGHGELGEKHILACRKTAYGTHPRQIHLPGAIHAEGAKGRLRMFASGNAELPTPEPSVLKPGERVLIAEKAVALREMSRDHALAEISARMDKGDHDRRSELFDAGYIVGSIRVRAWRFGDKMRPWGMSGTKLVSDILTDSHVTGENRRHALVVEDERGLLWIVAIRRSHRAPVGTTTRRVLGIFTEPESGADSEEETH
jgi:tRNA(Ile)-lysidine synthase